MYVPLTSVIIILGYREGSYVSQVALYRLMNFHI